MKVKTADLIDAPLDWAVAQCEGEVLSQASLSFQIKEYGCLQRPHLGNWKPSASWAQGRLIIERERVELLKGNPILFVDGTREALWIAKHQSVADRRPNGVHGPTPLIAAMRCFVASRLGDEVDIPDELV